ncbi:LOW QUALITY PROTEIN: protein CHROMATIN REMODELING 20-like [Salvia miltiorrhiza]|uniref:LOW QUALITY PROTEIN: protein CHROMATIN REMODELING 20-like n=1 Tax=Salvia miltiorrhiza TaxID=226208 RepID=UPI0025AD81E9|nr:LOW QUALITY PROTEIN: protein CHROMATIN REMODELING 20-like [Salvia miltiorrhiza]
MENGNSDDDYLENESIAQYYEDEEESFSQEPLSEEELENLVAELVEIERKSAEAQEALEEEPLMEVEADAREELAQSLSGDELEKAVLEEMSIYKEEWELMLDELEKESAYLLEQLDGSGIDLSSLYKWIEKQVPNICHTEAWKGRTHWVGTQISDEATKSVLQAEEYLKIHRPVRRWHGASGFLGKKIAKCDKSVAVDKSMDKDWEAFGKLCSETASNKDNEPGATHWASVYLASTPLQAAALGLKSAGVDEVEEIDDVDAASSDPFVADAISNERDLCLTEEQKRNLRKIKEEDDAKDDLKLHNHLKEMRRRRQNREGELSSIDEESHMDVVIIDDNGSTEDVTKHLYDLSADPDREKAKRNYDTYASNSVVIFSSSESDSDKEANVNERRNVKKSEVVTISSSDSDSEADGNVDSSTKSRRKKIRRILDDAELGEETQKKIAIEKERQERLRSLEVTESVMVGKGVGVEVPDNASSGYIINLVREEDEEAVRIPPSISMKLKPHQISGIRFMWENIIQSARKVRSGDKGLGCILAHTMGLGKTFQVIAFLYTAMRCADLGLKTALILTPVSVLHNWHHEFSKWRPSELKPLGIFMLKDARRKKRLELLTKWRTKGGIFLIGYAAFRNLTLGKYVKDTNEAREISHALQVGPDILVCDEAHIIKNTMSDTTQALKLVKCQRRIALTGSPLQNNLMEYYCMVDFVREGFLGCCTEFRNRFQNPIENGQHSDATSEDVKIMNQRSHILYEQLKGFVHRMGASTVKNDLPSKTVFVIAVKLSTLQRRMYRGFLDYHGFAKGKATGDKKSFFAGYQALAQILNHPSILKLMKENKDQSKFEDVEKSVADEGPGDENIECNVISEEKLQNPQKKLSNAYVDEDWWSGLLPENTFKEVDYSGKMVLLLDILTMCSDMGDKALVFSQSLSTLELIEYYLPSLPRPGENGKCWEKGKDWYRLDGRMESSERQKLVDRFNEAANKRVRCVLISTRAGSLGINLCAANRVIIVDGSWNPTYDLQAIYRVWRYGQTKPVFAYRLMAHATIEEKIYKRQVNKEGLAARVVDRQQVHRTISKEEMVDLFDFVDDESALVLHDSGQEHVVDKPDTSGSIGDMLKQCRPPSLGASSDEVMQILINRHQPRWILSHHEHEALLQENEDEKLSKEEQDSAWDVYKKTLKLDVSADDQHKIIVDPSSQQSSTVVSKAGVSCVSTSVNDAATRRGKCTELSHLLTLRSQGTKAGCSTICDECGEGVSWEVLGL